jgi:hypothetical protein
MSQFGGSKARPVHHLIIAFSVALPVLPRTAFAARSAPQRPW